MNYDYLLTKLGRQGFFDLASVVQIANEPRKSIQMQLYRWCKNERLVPLRRGMYAIPELYNAQPINPAELANHLYSPSYISLQWALGYYGLIPERVVTFTSISSRVPRSFENAYGMFAYRHIKPRAFFGYRPIVIDNRKVRMAEPEKAMLDLWYMESGEWSRDRLAEMRFQNVELINIKRLANYAERFDSARLMKIVERWSNLSRETEEGTVEL